MTPIFGMKSTFPAALYPSVSPILCPKQTHEVEKKTSKVLITRPLGFSEPRGSFPAALYLSVSPIFVPETNLRGRKKDLKGFGYSTPFVLGRAFSALGSLCTAILMALASPLKMASIL